MKKTVTTPACPACGGTLRDKPAHNSYSRYRDLWICAPCGVREAFEGVFWHDLSKGRHTREQKRWMKAHERD